jgi:hypothetical protein
MFSTAGVWVGVLLLAATCAQGFFATSIGSHASRAQGNTHVLQQSTCSSSASRAVHMGATTVKAGDAVNVQLHIAANGKPWESNFDQGKVRFVVGGGGYLPAIHKAVQQMEVSRDTCSVTLQSIFHLASVLFSKNTFIPSLVLYSFQSSVGEYGL